MKASRSSKTAQQMALSRAVESRKPECERICYDPFAEQLLQGPSRWLLVARPLRDGVERLIEWLFAGHHFYVVVRTRYFDDFLLRQLAERPEQLVILGAGYDSRAHRFADRLRDVAVFEVDHPATSEEKRLRIGRALGGAVDRVKYVPVDFNVETLADRLRACGYQDGRKTVFLWEGVTPYLSAAAVDEVLRFVAGAASGSAILFDYVIASLLDGTCDMRGARNEFDKMSRGSEPLTFGIAQGEVEPFLRARGFRDVGRGRRRAEGALLPERCRAALREAVVAHRERVGRVAGSARDRRG